MKNEITLQTRREFLRSTVLGSALSWTVPAFLANTITALQAGAGDSATQIATGKDATILVVLQMAGGNDGLNTVVPFADDLYHRSRPTLRQVAAKAHHISDQLAFHPRMEGFARLFAEGQLAVVGRDRRRHRVKERDGRRGDKLGDINQRCKTVVTLFTITTLVIFALAGFWVSAIDGYQISSAILPNAVSSPLAKTVTHATGLW